MRNVNVQMTNRIMHSWKHDIVWEIALFEYFNDWRSASSNRNLKIQEFNKKFIQREACSLWLTVTFNALKSFIKGFNIELTDEASIYVSDVKSIIKYLKLIADLLSCLFKYFNSFTMLICKSLQIVFLKALLVAKFRLPLKGKF